MGRCAEKRVAEQVFTQRLALLRMLYINTVNNKEGIAMVFAGLTVEAVLVLLSLMPLFAWLAYGDVAR